MKNLFPNSPVLKRISVIGVTVLAVLLVVMTVAYAFTDQTVGASLRLYAGNSSTDVSFIAKNNDSVRVQAPLLVNGMPTFAGGVTASGVRFAVFDSFSTTSATKAVTMTGSAIGDVFIVTPMTTTYSAVVDTAAAFYYAKVDSAGYVTVGRSALLGIALKSGAHFAVVHIDK